MEEKAIQADVFIEKNNGSTAVGTSYSKNVETVEQCIEYGISLYEAFSNSHSGHKVTALVSCTDPEGNLEANARINYYEKIGAQVVIP